MRTTYLFIFSFILFKDPTYLNYLPYSTLLLFLGALRKKQKLFILIIVASLAIFQTQRNDMVKIIVALAIGLIVSGSIGNLNKLVMRR